MTNPVLASFNIQHIIMTESVFRRKSVIDFNKRQNPSVDVKTNYSLNPDGSIYCVVELSYSATYEDDTEPIIEARIVLGGLFTKNGETMLPTDTFGKVNAPAILFPFVREHLSSLSVKANIVPILLTPVNFEALSKQSQ